jgi:hypothetical protein
MTGRASSVSADPVERHVLCCNDLLVKVRIVSACEDDIDGVALNRFEVGLVYEVSPSVGSYLIATGCAVPVLTDEIAESDEEEQQFRVNVRRWREVAADVNRLRRRPGSP